MELFGMEKLSLVDFDGYVAATVFTGNCNFKCGFCHNAVLVVDYKNLDVLPEQDVLDYLKKRKGVLEGLCITGGEPTLQPDLPEFCEKVKNLGYAVKLDTNGTNPQMIQTLVNGGLCDYFAMDIKNDRKNYAKIIGFDAFDTKKIEQSVSYFLSGKTKYEFRTTLIGEYHKAENVSAIADWIAGADKYFFQKFKNGENCLTTGLSTVPEKTALEFTEIVKPKVKSIRLRGYDV